MRVKLFTNIASHYRKAIWLKLLRASFADFSIYFGKDKGSGIHAIDFDTPEFFAHKSQVGEVKNLWVGPILIWQIGVLRECLEKDIDTAIFLGNAYCLSTWLAAMMCNLRNIDVIFWGHGLYGDENVLKYALRKIFYSLADRHLIYNLRGKKLLAQAGFDPDSIYVVFNSLDYESHRAIREVSHKQTKARVFSFFKRTDLPVLIFIGRLIPDKRLDLLIEALTRLNQEQVRFNLLIVGDGEQRLELEDQGRYGVKDRWLYFEGACYNTRKLGAYLAKADLCISPGNVGLTAIHSLSFGTAVGTHSEMTKQGPEAEVIVEGKTGFLFKRDNVDDLVNSINQWFKHKPSKDQLKADCYERIDQHFNPSYQLSVFNKAINGQSPRI